MLIKKENLKPSYVHGLKLVCVPTKTPAVHNLLSNRVAQQLPTKE